MQHQSAVSFFVQMKKSKHFGYLEAAAVYDMTLESEALKAVADPANVAGLYSKASLGQSCVHLQISSLSLSFLIPP
uniref:Uncharacterized protein n=1 Tax=Rhizophora mucronata TaxID=61149 RepID=A0A2P2Q5D9_RHIMU